MSAYVPRPIYDVHALRYVVQPGDTIAGITRALGQPLRAYPELVGANPDRELTDRGVPPGQAACFAQLEAGDLLRVPSWWGPAPGVGVGKSGQFPEYSEAKWTKPPGTDAQLDLTGLKILGFVQDAYNAYKKLDPTLQTFPKNWAAMVYNCVNQWWRQGTPNYAPADLDACKPLIFSALVWAKEYGQYMDEGAAALIPWTSIPWRDVPWSPISTQDVFWLDVGLWCDQHFEPAKVSNNVAPIDWANVNWKSGEIPGSAWKGASARWNGIAWGTLPWTQIPWQCVPWRLVRWSEMGKAGATKQSNTAIVFEDMQAVKDGKKKAPVFDTSKLDPDGGKYGGVVYKPIPPKQEQEGDPGKSPEDIDPCGPGAMPVKSPDGKYDGCFPVQTPGGNCPAGFEPRHFTRASGAVVEFCAPKQGAGKPDPGTDGDGTTQKDPTSGATTGQVVAGVTVLAVATTGIVLAVKYFSKGR